MNAIGYKKCLLTILLVILAFNYVDRLALGLLLQEIKVDLTLTDTELGLLTGIAFALFYSVMGMPIARWADRGNRVVIISLTTAVWSIAVALCGAAGSFVQLLLIRIGVAVGEAGCVPPAHSLIADYFTRAERPRAVAIYMLGGPLSMVIGYFGAGWLNEFYGWRPTFVLLGLPGLGLAALAWFGLKEPRVGAPPWGINENISPTRSSPSSYGMGSDPLDRSHQVRPAIIKQADQLSLKIVGTMLWRNATFRHLLFYYAVGSFFSFGIGQWQPAFFMRSYLLQTGVVGSWFALVWGLGSAVGIYLGGEWASRRAANNERRQLIGMALAYSAMGVCSALMYLSSNQYLAFGLMALGIMGSTAVTGPLFATIQTLVPQRMRAMSIALLYLFANLIGMGLGPLAVGALSDLLRPVLGEESLRFALLAMCPGYLWGAWHLWRASKTVTRDIETVQDDGVGTAAEGGVVVGAADGFHGIPSGQTPSS